MKTKGHWVWLVAKERKLGVNDSGVNDSGVNDSLGVKAFPRAAVVYDRQLKIANHLELFRTKLRFFWTEVWEFF